VQDVLRDAWSYDGWVSGGAALPPQSDMAPVAESCVPVDQDLPRVFSEKISAGSRSGPSSAPCRLDARPDQLSH
jgi:hypothetical protein